MVDSAKGDGSPARIIETLQQGQDTALTRARCSAEGVRFASPYSKADIFESRVIRTLRVAHFDMVPVIREDLAVLTSMYAMAAAHKTMSPDAQSCSISPADVGAE